MRVGTLPVTGDLVGCNAHDDLDRVEEGPCRHHVVVLAQHGVDKVAAAIDGSIQVGPATTNLQVRLIHVPAAVAVTTLVVQALAEFIGQRRCELRLPVADRFVAEHDATGEDISAKSRRVRR